MEAIEPGSSAIINPATSDGYEDVFPDADQAESSNNQATRSRKDPPLLVEVPAIYDEPNTETLVTLHQVKHQVPSFAVYDDPDESAPVRLLQTPLYTHWKKKLAESKDPSETFNVGNNDDDDNDDEIIYDEVDRTEELEEQCEDVYENTMSTNVSSPPPRSSKVPQELQQITEISLEHLHSLDPKEAQMWMLSQMQKAVQKIRTAQLSPNSMRKWQNYASKKAPDSHITSNDNVKLHVNDFEMPSDRQPTHNNPYENLSEALAATTAPTVPPKTYKTAAAQNEGGNYRDRTKSELHQTKCTIEHDQSRSKQQYSLQTWNKTATVCRDAFIGGGIS